MSDFQVMTMEEIEKAARKKRCSVVVAQANELQFDLDSEQDVDRFENFFNEKLLPFYPNATQTRWRSKSGNDHVVVSLPADLPVIERIALQAIGGSDLGREWAALRCHSAGSQHPILLFKPEVA